MIEEIWVQCEKDLKIDFKKMYKYQGVGKTTNVVKLTNHQVYGIINTARKRRGVLNVLR